MVIAAREEAPPAEAMPPALKRFKFLAAKMSQPQSSSSNAMALTLATPRSVSVAETTRSQLVQYFAELQNWQNNPVSSAGIQSTSTNTSASTGGSTDALQFWKKNSNLNKLAPIAQDLICAPASQAFVERVFSLCGILTAGRRSSMKRSLEMRVFLKLNKRVLEQTGFTV